MQPIASIPKNHAWKITAIAMGLGVIGMASRGQPESEPIQGIRTPYGPYDKIHGINTSSKLTPFGSGRNTLTQFMQEANLGGKPWIRASSLGYTKQEEINKVYMQDSEEDPESRGRMSGGELIHKHVQRMLYNTGHGTGAEIAVSDPIERTHGSIDFMLHGNIPLEIKTVDKMRDLRMMDKAKETAISQANAYAVMVGAPYSVVMYTSREDQSQYKSFKIPTDLGRYKADVARLRLGISRIPGNPIGYNSIATNFSALSSYITQPNGLLDNMFGSEDKGDARAPAYYSPEPPPQGIRQQYPTAYGGFEAMKSHPEANFPGGRVQTFGKHISGAFSELFEGLVHDIRRARGIPLLNPNKDLLNKTFPVSSMSMLIKKTPVPLKTISDNASTVLTQEFKSGFTNKTIESVAHAPLRKPQGESMRLLRKSYRERVAGGIEAFFPEYGVDETLKSIMDRRGWVSITGGNTASQARKVLARVPKGSKLIGEGSFNKAYLTPKGDVLRIGPHEWRANVPEVLQATSTRRIGPVQMERLPFVENIHDVSHEEMTALGASLQKKDLAFWDPGSRQIGTHKGKKVIVDSGSVVPWNPAVEKEPWFNEQDPRHIDWVSHPSGSTAESIVKPPVIPNRPNLLREANTSTPSPMSPINHGYRNQRRHAVGFTPEPAASRHPIASRANRSI